VSISPVYRIRLLALILMIVSLAACSSTPPTTLAPTSPPPTFDSGAVPTVSPPLTNQGERIWLERPLGQSSTLTIKFYSVPDGKDCLRYEVPGNDPGEACAASSTEPLAVIQGVVTDNDGTKHTIIAGRILNEKPTVITLLFNNGESIPVQIDQDGFIVVLDGTKLVHQVVPIDQFGNLVGEVITLR
jgi:hypothetical protein